ncbi:MAG: hypothetical protein HOW73_41020 [Polyangiaceae bacterium]|nr:hypothetical protein [Polyangiaceae bacterium]
MPDVNPHATLPFKREGGMDLILLDRYAELAAALRKTPENADAIMRSFGLETEEQRGKIHKLWRLRFQANPDLQRRFEKLVEDKLATEAGDR